MLGECIRSTVFWALDFVKGSKIRKHYKDIRYLMESKDRLNVLSVKARYLNEILIYATNNVKFYEKYKLFKTLQDFPVINKNILKKNYEDFKSFEYKNSKVIELHTSGSTGTPFTVIQDTNKRNRVLAEMIYFWGKAGYRVGMKYIYFRIWTEINRKNKLTAFARNLIMCDIIRLDQVKLEGFRKMIKQNRKIKMLLGYGSTLENIANYLYKCGDNPSMFGIKTIISCSESLPEITRNKLEKVFGCNVVSLYSNQENGMIAIECIEKKEFHINEASYYVEILKMDSDKPADLNEPGRIVITDYFNHAFPLIRYDTGDIGICVASSQCNWDTKIFKTIEGRKVDFIYDTQGRVLSPHTITNYMWPYDKILQFQFIQENKKSYILKLNGAKGLYEDNEFKELFKNILGQDAIIDIEHVDEIPVLSSGKKKKVVCNIKGGFI